MESKSRKGKNRKSVTKRPAPKIVVQRPKGRRPYLAQAGVGVGKSSRIFTETDFVISCGYSHGQNDYYCKVGRVEAITSYSRYASLTSICTTADRNMMTNEIKVRGRDYTDFCVRNLHLTFRPQSGINNIITIVKPMYLKVNFGMSYDDEDLLLDEPFFLEKGRLSKYRLKYPKIGQNITNGVDAEYEWMPIKDVTAKFQEILDGTIMSWYLPSSSMLFFGGIDDQDKPVPFWVVHCKFEIAVRGPTSYGQITRELRAQTLESQAGQDGAEEAGKVLVSKKYDRDLARINHQWKHIFSEENDPFSDQE